MPRKLEERPRLGVPPSHSGIQKLGKIIHFHGDAAGGQGAGLNLAPLGLGKKTVLEQEQEAVSMLQPSF